MAYLLPFLPECVVVHVPDPVVHEPRGLDGGGHGQDVGLDHLQPGVHHVHVGDVRNGEV